MWSVGVAYFTALRVILQEVDKVKMEFSHDQLFDFYQKVIRTACEVSKSLNVVVFLVGIYSRAAGQFKLITC